MNVPFDSPNKGDTEYINCFERIFMPIAKQFNPDLVIVSSGFGIFLFLNSKLNFF